MPDRGGVTLHFASRVIHSAQMSRLNKADHRVQSRDLASGKSAGTNTRSAPRRHAPRRPCCSLCSARARSSLRTTQPRASVGSLVRSLRHFLRPGFPPSESLRLPSPTPNRSEHEYDPATNVPTSAGRMSAETVNASRKKRASQRDHTSDSQANTYLA